MGSDDAMDQATAAVLDHNKHIQKTKGRRHGHEEIAGNNSLTVQAKEPSRYCERLSSHSSSKRPKNWGAIRAQMAREIGSLRTSMERAKLWTVGTGLGTILSVWSAAFALARFLKP